MHQWDDVAHSQSNAGPDFGSEYFLQNNLSHKPHPQARPYIAAAIAADLHVHIDSVSYVLTQCFK